MLSNFNSKLNVKSTPNLISVDYFELIYEFITELMVFAKYADFRIEKTTFTVFDCYGVRFCSKENKLFMNLFEVYQIGKMCQPRIKSAVEKWLKPYSGLVVVS